MTPHALIIDDQYSNIQVLAMLLEQEGVTYSAVTTTLEVFPMLDQISQLDVVFLDLEMPNGDYYQLLHELKADTRLAGVPITAYTVHTSEMDAVRAAGFDSFLGKPLRAADFPQQLRRILSGETVWA
jgi:two-component system, cell cycle response regulator DivK